MRQQLGGSAGVVQCRVRTVGGQPGGATAVVQAAAGRGQEMRREPHGAQATLGANRHDDPELLELRGQEHGVEGEVVRDHRPAPQQGGDVPGQLGERRCAAGLRGGDAVDVLRPEIAVRIDEAAPLVLVPLADDLVRDDPA